MNSNGSQHRDVYLEEVATLTGSIDLDTTPLRAANPDLARQIMQADLALLNLAGAGPLQRADGIGWRPLVAFVPDVVGQACALPQEDAQGQIIPGTHLVDRCVLPGHDSLDGGDGDDLLVGDNGLIYSPLVSGLAEIDAATQQAQNALDNVLHSLRTLGIDHDHAEHNLRNAAHQRDLYVGQDQILGGAGADTIIGDNGLIMDTLVLGLPVPEDRFVAAALSAVLTPSVTIPEDTNGDGMVTPLDVLLLINYLNAHASGDGTLVGSFPAAYDVNRDGRVTPLDVLLVINHLNIASLAGGEGESAPDSGLYATVSSASAPAESSRVEAVSRETSPRFAVSSPAGTLDAQRAKFPNALKLNLQTDRTAVLDDLFEDELQDALDDIAAQVSRDWLR